MAVLPARFSTVVVAAALAVSATAVPALAAAPAPVTVAVHHGALGSYLVGKGGRTLYLWVADPKNRSVCTGACATYWPPVLGTAKAGRGLSQAAFGSIRRSDGSRQVTFHGHPLYYFADDSAAGATTGEGSDGFGARWWAVSPAGHAIKG